MLFHEDGSEVVCSAVIDADSNYLINTEWVNYADRTDGKGSTTRKRHQNCNSHCKFVEQAPVTNIGFPERNIKHC